MNYKIKLFVYFAAVFATFTVGVAVYQAWREKEYKEALLIGRMEQYAAVASKDRTSKFLPSDLRITIIGTNGRVAFDNSADTTLKIENHFSRPEIVKAKTKASGWDIRRSQTTGKEYIYYAMKTDSSFVRVAMPYTIQTKGLLAVDKSFIWFVSTLFITALVCLWFIARRFGTSMHQMDNNAKRSRQQSETLKAQMTSSIAHELRTPIATIRGYTETLLDDTLPEDKRRQFIERAYLSSVRLSDLVRDVSLLSKLEENATSFDRKTINIHKLVDDVVESFEGMIHNNSIKVENQLPENLTILGNTTLVQSIFSNLIENSIKYAGKWVTLTISLTKIEGSRAHIRIADTGMGVDPIHLTRLFERFYRVDSSRARSDGGSGLGLSIVRHAVLYHGGQITASLAPAGGLVVDFDLEFSKK